MKVHYCDLCDCPVHGKKFLLNIVEEEEGKDTQKQPFRKTGETQELCETCNLLLSRLFINRKKGLTDLVQIIEDIFGLQVRGSKHPKGEGPNDGI